VLAGLIASNAREVARTEFGFDPARTIAVHAWPPTTQLVRALEALPQVHRVAAVSAVPLTGGAQRVHARIGARSEPLHVRAANAEFFDVFGIQSVHGRALHRADEGGAMVAVVSRRTAELLWPGQDPLGRTLELPPDDPPGSMPSGTFEVVGVVEDVVSNSFVQGIDPTAVYVPAKVPHAALGSLVVHSVDSAPATQQAIMEACVRAAAERNCELMPLLLAIKFQRLPFLAASVAAASLGWIALAISCIGLYGLVSYVVVQKRREIGVRVALGARGTTVVREVLAGSVRQVGLGVAIGLPLAFALTRVVAAHTDSLRTFDVASFVAIPLALAAVALLAAWLPARRSARIAPTEALRLD